MASASLKAFLEKAVEDKLAPGLVAVSFNRDGTFAEACAGVSNIETGTPMKENSVVWMASMSKSVSSVCALMLVEKHQFDIDSHDALAAIVPELADTPGNPIWTVFDGKDSEGQWKFKRATVGVTLRHLLTHTAGFAYDFNSEEGRWMTDPEGGKYESLFSAKISALVVPRLFEAGTAYQYGTNTDFVGLFLTRISGMNARQAYQELVFTPLGITELDQFRSPSMDERRVAMGYQVAEGEFIPLPMPFDTAQFDGEPPEGMVSLISGPLWGKLSEFAIFARALLNETAPSVSGIPLLSPAMWKIAVADQMGPMKIPANKPFAVTSNPQLMCSIDTWSATADKSSEGVAGWNLLQTVAALEASASGLSASAFGWAGLANSFYFMDPVLGCGGVIAAQFFPWAPAGMVKLRDDFERWTVDAHAAK